MAILRNCELHFCKLDPERPSTQLNKKNPSWEIQMRTKNKTQKEEWVNQGIKVTAVREDEEGPILYWRANLRRKKFKADGTEADAPEVKDGQLKAVDPNTIGNGSIGNVRIFQYDYKDKETNVEGKATVLMGVQLTKHIIYKPKPRNDDDDFEVTETEVVDTTDEDEGNEEVSTEKETTISGLKVPPTETNEDGDEF
jgi:hypothetical protein